jgi:hypothetical protein
MNQQSDNARITKTIEENEIELDKYLEEINNGYEYKKKIIMNNHWVSIKDQLPTEDDEDDWGRVLIINMTLDKNSTRSEIIPAQAVRNLGKHPTIGMTHWMALPKNPKYL